MEGLTEAALIQFYEGTEVYLMEEKQAPLISYFKPPINAANPTPVKDVTLKQIHKAIVGDTFKEVTQDAQNKYKEAGSKRWPDAQGKENNPFRMVKENQLPYVCFGGTFAKRANSKLIEESGFYCFDLDHLKDRESERKRILAIKDDFFTTNLLFTSPSGEGLKWIISIAANEHDYSMNYKGLQGYLKTQYNIKETDNTPDISRACFLCHDPNVYYYEAI